MKVSFVLTILTCVNFGVISSGGDQEMQLDDVRKAFRDVAVYSLESQDSPAVINSSDSQIRFIVQVCKAFLDEYAKQSSLFTKCLVEYSRPFRFCETCVAPYKKASTVFSDLMEDDLCSKELLMADRIQVVRFVNSNMENVWQSAHCEDCFSSITEDANGTVNYTQTNNTIHFFQLFHNMTECLNQTTENFEGLDDVGNISFCDKCRTQYKSLNSHFTSMVDQTSSQVCMDIVDMMNYTRLNWSKKLHCSNRHGTIAPVLVITSVICALPVIFYVANRLIRPTRERTIRIRQRVKFPQTPSNYGAMNGSHQTLFHSNSQTNDSVGSYR